MSEPKLFPTRFRNHTLHTVLLGDRPAWIAREIGDALGYARQGKRLVNKIKGEWADEFVAQHDFTLAVGAELAAVKAAVPSVPPSARGLLMLYESGLHLVLAKTHMPLGRELRRFLVEEVLPQLVRTGSYAAESSLVDLPRLHETRLASRVDLDDRRFRAATLQRTADDLALYGHIDERTRARMVVLACEIALGHRLPELAPPDDEGWVMAEVLAHRHGWSLSHMLGAATALGLLDDPAAVDPVPVRGGRGWTVTFRFSRDAVQQLEAWLDDHAETDPNLPLFDHAA